MSRFRRAAPTGRWRPSGWVWIGALIGVLVLAAVLAVNLYVPRHRSGSPVEVEVSSGMSLAGVAENLRDEGVIRNRWVFLLAGRWGGVDTRVKTGHYTFSPAQSTAEILRLLRQGSVSLTRLTIPEGLTAEQTAASIERQTGLPVEAFLGHVDSVDASSLLGFPADGMEGFLFPNTYMVSEGVRPQDIVRLMSDAFHEAVGDSFLRKAWAADLSPFEVVTLASIIEKEARVPEERPRISAVFHNRLRKGWRLEADPTVRYALKNWNGLLTYKDLEVDSPYNTYRVRGLPPGPIASPGRASIEAALNPRPDVDDLYFVARGDGSHEFSKTLAAHLRAIDRLRRKRR